MLKKLLLRWQELKQWQESQIIIQRLKIEIWQERNHQNQINMQRSQLLKTKFKKIEDLDLVLLQQGKSEDIKNQQNYY